MNKYSTAERIKYYETIRGFLIGQAKRINQRLISLNAQLEREKAAVPVERSASEEALDEEFFENLVK